MRTYKELTSDRGIAMHCSASDNRATYIGVILTNKLNYYDTETN